MSHYELRAGPRPAMGLHYVKTKRCRRRNKACSVWYLITLYYVNAQILQVPGMQSYNCDNNYPMYKNITFTFGLKRYLLI